MYLMVVQIDPRMRQAKAATQIQKAIKYAESRYKHLPLLLTVDYQSHKYLLGLGIRAKLFSEELAPEVEEGIIEEAQRRAEEIIRKVGEARLLFKGVNPFNALHYQISTHIAGILRVNNVVQSKATQPGIILLFTSSRLLGKAPGSGLPVLDLFRVGSVKRWRYFGATCRFFLKSLTRVKSFRLNNPKPGRAEPSPPGNRKHVLFVTVDNRMCMEPLTPVLRKLRESSDIEPFVAVESPSSPDYLKAGPIESFAYSQYYHMLESTQQWARSFRMLRRMALKLEKEHDAGTIDALIASSFRRQFVNFGTLVEVYSRILWMKYVLELSRPDAVVAYPLHSHVVRAAISLARTRKVPTLAFVYSWVYGQKPGGDLLAFRTYDNSDFIIATGEDCVQALVRDGVDPKKILLVGNPKFDVIKNMSSAQDRNFICRHFGAKPSDHIFLVTSYVLVPGTMEWVRALVRQLKMFSDGFKLIIKPHPDENPAEYERILKEEKLLSATVSIGVPLYTLLNASDIVFTGMSTTGSEALLFNKPLICLNLSEIPYSVRYDEAGVALLVKNEQQILPTIERVLHDPKVRSELEGARKRVRELFAYKLDGRASERFVKAIRVAIDPARGDGVLLDLLNTTSASVTDSTSNHDLANIWSGLQLRFFSERSSNAGCHLT